MLTMTDVKEKAEFLRLSRIIQERREKRWLSRSRAINSFDVTSWPDGKQLRPVDPRERWQKMKSPDPWLGIMKAINSFQGQSLPGVRQRRSAPVDPRERWRQMAGKDLHSDMDWLNRSTSRKFAHLRSEVSYHQEIALCTDNNTPQARQKQKRQIRSRSFSIRDKLREVKTLVKRKAKHPADCGNLCFNTITEESQDITEWKI